MTDFKIRAWLVIDLLVGVVSVGTADEVARRDAAAAVGIDLGFDTHVD